MKSPMWSAAALIATGLCLALTAHAAPPDRILSGDLLVANHDVLVGHAGVVKIDPVTGDQTVLYKGGFIEQPNDVVVGPDKVYVADSSALNIGAVLSIGIQSRKQAVVTSGGLLDLPEGIALEANGQLLVTFLGALPSAIVRVDPTTGQQSSVSMLPGQALRVAVESTGQILVGILNGPDGPHILRVDPVTGAQSVVSLGGLITNPQDLGVASNGDIIVLNRDPSRILRVNPTSGAQSVISSDGLLETPSGIAVASNDDIFVVDPKGTDSPDGQVIRIDPTTGAQSLLSEGQKLLDPLGISVAP